MARMKRVTPVEPTGAIVPGKRTLAGTVMLPTSPMPGSRRRGHAVEKPVTEKLADLRKKYVLYLREMLAFNRDESGALLLPHLEPVRALAVVFNISQAEAERRQFELHDKLTQAARGVRLDDLMRNYDVTPEARVAILAYHAHQIHNSKQSLQAIRLLEGMDSTAAAGGDSFEVWFDAVLAEKRTPRRRSA